LLRPDPSFLPLFTQVRGRVILQTSPLGGSRKFAKKLLEICPSGVQACRPYSSILKKRTEAGVFHAFLLTRF
jgi:hypothetical protein